MAESQSNIEDSNTIPAPETCAKTDAPPSLQALLASFIKAKKDLLLYPSGNAMVTESMERLLHQLRQACPADKAVEIHVERDRLSINGLSASTSDSRVSDLCLSLYERGVQKIIIDSDIPLEEMKTLLRILSTKPQEVAAAGGIEKLFSRMEILHAAVQSTPELMIVEGDTLSLPTDLPPWLEALDGLDLNTEDLDGVGRLSHLFMKVKEGDLDSFKPLLALVRKPEVFSELLEKFNLKLQKLGDATDSATRVDRLLTVLHTVGAAIASVTSEDKRSQLFKNLAFSLLGLSSDLKAELVNHGLMPNLALKSIEAEIMSRFPVTQLADMVFENFELSGGAASVMHAYFANLDLSGASRITLAEILRNRLRDAGKLSTDVEAVLKQQSVSDSQPEQGEPPTGTGDPAPRTELYPPEKVVFLGDERARLMSEIAAELEQPVSELIAPALMELMRYETVPAHYAALLTRAASLLEQFMQSGDYEKAALLLNELRTELKEKMGLFSNAQLEPLRSTIEEYLSEKRILALIEKFGDLNKESPEFAAIVKFFGEVGESAIVTLARALESEESRRVRLLICRALADLGEKSIATVVAKLDHPQWYVVRNAVSVLGQIARPTCVPHLRKALSHRDIRVRKEALKGLASIRTDEAIELVCECVNAEDPEMRRAAVAWISAMQSEKAVPALVTLLDEKAILKQDDDIIRLAIDALGTVESEAAVELLAKLSHTRSLIHSKKAAFIRESAQRALRNNERHSAQCPTRPT
ncbi:MAG: hypothetical protein Kow0099_04190 [Candidatus Abyssubacteria bacterium]